MNIDQKIIRNSGQAGIFVGILVAIVILLFALFFGQLQDPLNSLNLSPIVLFPSLFYTILGSIFVSVVLSVVFGALFHYIPTKKVVTKYFIFRSIFFTIGTGLTVLFGLFMTFKDISVEILNGLTILFLSIVVFAFSFDKISKTELIWKEQELASIKRRFFAIIIDFLAIGLVLLLLAGIIFSSSSDELKTTQGIQEIFKDYILLLYLGWSLYWPFCDFFFQQTMGKILLGIEVKKEDGTKIGLKECFIRNLPKMVVPVVGLIPLAADSLALFKSGKKQRIFDIIAGTVVTKRIRIIEVKEQKPRYLSQK